MPADASAARAPRRRRGRLRVAAADSFSRAAHFFVASNSRSLVTIQLLRLRFSDFPAAAVISSASLTGRDMEIFVWRSCLRDFITP